METGEQRQEAADAEKTESSWVAVEKGMLSRMLYPNPVCLLSVWDAAAAKAYVMTITWLTPINNQGGFICSMNCNRNTAQYVNTSGSIFVLNVPVRGMEELVLSIGGCSGASVDKFESFKIETCKPGGGAATANRSGAQQPTAKKQKLSKQDLARQVIAEALDKSIAIRDCVAHLLCRVESVQVDDGHYLLRCSLMAAWSKAQYWNGRNFIAQTPDTAPYLTFLGSKVFGYVTAEPGQAEVEATSA